MPGLFYWCDKIHELKISAVKVKQFGTSWRRFVWRQSLTSHHVADRSKFIHVFSESEQNLLKDATWSLTGLYLDREGISRDDLSPMLANKLFPSRFALSLWMPWRFKCWRLSSARRYVRDSTKHPESGGNPKDPDALASAQPITRSSWLAAPKELSNFGNYGIGFKWRCSWEPQSIGSLGMARRSWAASPKCLSIHRPVFASSGRPLFHR